ncbi:MAG: DEAD/DEAH box helicase [Lentisphaerae bacterium]|nr:DEAD/DEAH box helicase [Lentisphaerota bacterium]
MSLELALSPGGCLYLLEAEAVEIPLPAAFAARLRQRFEESPAAGLLLLAGYNDQLTSSLAFGRSLVRLYLTALCHAPRNGNGDIPEVAAPDESAWLIWIESAPPLRGMEFFDAARGDLLWGEIHSEVVSRAGGDIDAYLRSINPAWRTVGHVTFHLAENKKNSERPFAFMATYASRLSESGRVQHQPLKRALAEYAGANNRAALLRLLEPVQQAMERSKLVKKLFETGQIYQPLAWSVQEAYIFLREAQLFEEAGLVVRVPDWWSVRKPPRPIVNVSVGEERPSHLGADALLDFKMSLTLNGEELSKEEIAALLVSESGLVSLRGQWVEIDPDQLKEVLGYWESVAQSVENSGLSFSEAIRLVSGVGEIGATAPEMAEQVSAWSGVTAGKWLTETLGKLRQSSGASIKIPCADGVKADLRPYQIAGVEWLHFVTSLGLGGCLADDMGLGKTLQTLTLLLWLKMEGAVHRPSLLVVPASLLANWRDEAQRFTPTLRLLTAHPSGGDAQVLAKCGQNPDAVLADYDLVVTTYGMVARAEWLNSVEWRLVILDEAQAIKNPGTRQARAVKSLKAQSRLALTGTPVENRAGDLWSLFDFINPGLLGSAKSFTGFINSRDSLPDAYAPIRRLVRPYILRRLKTDRSVIADLPEKTVMTSYCGLTSAQAALYSEQVRQLKEVLRESAADSAMKRRAAVLTALMRFKQICNHPAQITGDGNYAEERSGKFERLRALCSELAENQEKVLVFTQYRELTEPLAAFLATVFRRSGLVLHGGTPVGRRRELVGAFQRDDGPPFFVLSLKAGGTGLNLTEASHVIHFDRWWNPAVENQATDRAFRIGQKRNVMVHTFVCRGTVEEKIAALLEEKQALADELLAGGGEKLLTEMPDQELLEFVALDLAAATM